MPTLTLVPRPVAGSVDELLAGATHREPFLTTDSKSGAPFERVTIDGQPHVVKYLHVDEDWIMRMSGDVRCRPLLMWQSGLLDALPDCFDHAMVGAATGLGRNGWGAALLMRDVESELVPPGDDVLSMDQHLGFLDHLAALAARFWGFEDTVGLTPFVSRWAWFGPGMLAVEEARGWPDAVPPIAAEGWDRFANLAGPELAGAITDLRHDLAPLTTAIAATPVTLLHGDWKLGNLGTTTDGRTILLDWAGPGAGPVAADVAWYVAINRARIPQSKEDALAAFPAALRRHGLDPDDWWDQQLALCLLGAVVIFGWEKAYGTPDELGWWCDRAREGLRHL